MGRIVFFRSHSATAISICLAMILVLSFTGPLFAQPRPRSHKILFVSGFNILTVAQLSYVKQDGWNAIRNYLKTGPFTRDLNLQDADFLYFSYTGNYAPMPDGKKDYTKPQYLPHDTEMVLADYERRAKIIDEIIEAFPDAQFDIIAHSLGGVVATYWAANSPFSPLASSPINRVNSIVTLDSPLLGVAGPCGSPFPFTMLPTLTFQPAASKVFLVNIANENDTVVPADLAILPSAQRKLRDNYSLNPNAIFPPCDWGGHGTVLENTVVLSEIATAIMPGHIINPHSTNVANAGSNTNPVPFEVSFTHPKQTVNPINFQFSIGNRLARIIDIKDIAPVLRIYRVTLQPPAQPFGGRYDLELGYDSQSDLQIQAVEYSGPARVPVGGGTTTSIVLDISGSMGNRWQGGVKIESAKSAATNVVDMIEQENKVSTGPHQVSVVSFSTSSKVESPSNTDYQTARKAIAALSAQANTNVGAGIDSGNQQLQNAPAGVTKVMVLMTDGLNNTGMSNSQILDGPVKQAASAGTCMFAIGYGNKGDLDESFLQQIANASPCGHYYYASSGMELQNIYVRSRHEALGKIEAEFKGKIQQGQTIKLGQVSVQPNQSALYATLNWPGSQLDLILTDPVGQLVNQNYPGANISRSERLVYLIVDKPQSGTWNASILGRDVPEGTTDYNAVFSTRTSTVSPQSGGASALWLFVLFAAAAIPLGAILLQRRKQQFGYVWAGFRWNVRTHSARLYLVIDGSRHQTFSLLDGFTIGRSGDNRLVLSDDRVSRHHAVIRFANGRYFIQDTSRYGTLLNGRPIQASVLHSGDRVTIGNQEFLFEENPS